MNPNLDKTLDERFDEKYEEWGSLITLNGYEILRNAIKSFIHQEISTLHDELIKKVSARKKEDYSITRRHEIFFNKAKEEDISILKQSKKNYE